MIVSNKTRIMTAVAVVVLLFFGCARVPVVVEQKPRLASADIPPALQELFERAEDAFEKGRTDDALQLYEQLLTSSSAESSVALLAHVRKGALYAGRGDDEKVVTELQHLSGRFPGDPLYNEGRFYLARSYVRLIRYDDATAVITHLLTEELPRSRRAELHSLMGDTRLGQGRSYEAFLEYGKALNERPSDAVAIHCKTNMEEIAIHYLTLSELEELNRAYTREYPAGHLLYALAKSYYEAHDITNAKTTLEMFLARFQEHRYYDDARDLDARFREMELVNRSALGCILPLSGKYADYGTMALEAIILASGVFDSGGEEPVSLVIEDSKSDPETARAAVIKLATEDRVMGILGPMGSATSRAAAEEAQIQRIPLLTLTQRNGITETGDYIFRNFLTAAMQVRTLVHYAVQNLGIRNFAILYPQDNYGIEMMNIFWDEVLRTGGDIHGVESYRNRQTDFGAAIKALTGLDQVEKKPDGEDPAPVIDFDALFIPDSYERVAMIAPQLAFYDVTGVQLLGTNAWNSPDLLAKDNEYLEGAIFVDGFFRDTYYPDAREFIDRFYVAYGREPTDMEALAYDSARIMIQVMREGDVEVRDDMRNRILQINDYPGITGTTSFREGRDAAKSLYVLMVRDNEIIQIK